MYAFSYEANFIHTSATSLCAQDGRGVSHTSPLPRGLLEGEGALGANSEQLQSGWGAL